MAEDVRPPAVPGIQIGVAMAGIRKAGRKDVALWLLDDGATVAGVFTRNRFCAAPVQICRSVLAAGQSVRALVVNTGNANAGTGADGLARAQAICEAVATQLDVDVLSVLPFSTGVIMETLPHERIIAALPSAVASAAPENWALAAEAIMTTDTVPKVSSRQIEWEGHVVTVTGVAKGAGMIRPNMATMLGFVATDACISHSALQTLVQRVADRSFNRITVDGDTSTNDAFMLMASGHAQHARVESLDSAQGILIEQAVTEVAQDLARAIVRDGEGATKFITIEVVGGRTEAECAQVAYAVAHSPLVKTAFFASDPNLGRILAAIGHAGVEDLVAECIDVHLDEVQVAVQGQRHPQYQEEAGQRVMQRRDITVRIHLHRGAAQTTVWTCDLSHDYVSINADYRS